MRWQDVVLISLVSGLFVVGPNLNDLIFSLLACYTVDDGKSGLYPQNQAAVGSFWVPAMTELCFADWHLRVAVPLGFVGIGVFTIGFPLALLAALLWERRNIIKLARSGALLPTDSKSPAARHRLDFSFLREQYAPHAWYWSPVAAIEITALVAVVRLGLELPGNQQCVLMQLIQSLILVGELCVEPYEDALVMRASMASLVALQVTSMVSNFFYSATAGASASALDPGSLMALQVVTLVCNCAVVAVLVLWLVLLWSLRFRVAKHYLLHRISSLRSNMGSFSQRTVSLGSLRLSKGRRGL